MFLLIESVGMKTQDFIDGFIPPGGAELAERFMVPLPAVDGLTLQYRFRLQACRGDIWSAAQVDAYRGLDGALRLVDVYRNTQHRRSGLFVRLVGTMGLIVRGCPFVFLEATVSNVSPVTAAAEPLTTRVVAHFPQAAEAVRWELFDALRTAAAGCRGECREVSAPTLPAFWGPLLVVTVPGLKSVLIRDVRRRLARWYCASVTEMLQDAAPDYRAVQDQMIYCSSRAETRMFARMGLDLPCAAQAALFTILSVEAPECDTVMSDDATC